MWKLQDSDSQGLDLGTPDLVPTPFYKITQATAQFFNLIYIWTLPEPLRHINMRWTK